MDNLFNSGGGEQNIAQGQNAIGNQVNNYGIPPELFAQYVRDLGVTDSALESFFKILEQESIPCSDWGVKLAEIAFRYKELLQRFEAVTSDDPQVKALKEQVKQAIENGDYDQADALLNQAKERDRAAVATLKASVAEQQAALEKRQAVSNKPTCNGCNIAMRSLPSIFKSLPLLCLKDARRNGRSILPVLDITLKRLPAILRRCVSMSRACLSFVRLVTAKVKPSC